MPTQSTWNSDKASLLLWLITGLMAIILTILGYLGAEVRAEVMDHSKVIPVLKEASVDVRQDVLEIRQDVKQILREMPRSP